MLSVVTGSRKQAVRHWVKAYLDTCQRLHHMGIRGLSPQQRVGRQGLGSCTQRGMLLRSSYRVAH